MRAMNAALSTELTGGTTIEIPSLISVAVQLPAQTPAIGCDDRRKPKFRVKNDNAELAILIVAPGRLAGPHESANGTH